MPAGALRPRRTRSQSGSEASHQLWDQLNRRVVLSHLGPVGVGQLSRLDEAVVGEHPVGTGVLLDQVERLEHDKQEALARAAETERTVKQLKKEKKRILAETDGVSLADLHYSNERLSAQLTQLQRQQQAQEGESKAADANRIAELDMAVRTLTNELTAVEHRVASTNSAHDDERRRLQAKLDSQFRDFSVERAECDAVVQAMGAKLEALNFRLDGMQNENSQLKQQLIAAQSQAAALQATQQYSSGGRTRR